jgi:hypothetical protein
LCYFLLKRSIASEEVPRQLEIRHQKRKSSIQSVYRKMTLGKAEQRTGGEGRMGVGSNFGH